MPGSIIGAAVKRVEDPRFIRGAGTYIPNMPTQGEVHAAMVRSPIAHGRLNGIDTTLAEGMDGIVGVFTAADLGAPHLPLATRAIPDGLEHRSLESHT